MILMCIYITQLAFSLRQLDKLPPFFQPYWHVEYETHFESIGIITTTVSLPCCVCA